MQQLIYLMSYSWRNEEVELVSFCNLEMDVLMMEILFETFNVSIPMTNDGISKVFMQNGKDKKKVS